MGSPVNHTAMRKISIIKGMHDEGGRKFPDWEKREGFVREAKLPAGELVKLAGWPDGTNVCIDVQNTDESFFDSDYEETRAEQELVGNSDYGYVDGDMSKWASSPLNPISGQSWVFVLGMASYLN